MDGDRVRVDHAVQPVPAAGAVAFVLAGAVFVAMSLEAIAASFIWAFAAFTGFPAGLILALHVLGLLASVLAGVALGAHAFRLETLRAAGALV